MANSINTNIKSNTTAHLLSTVANELTHVARHHEDNKVSKTAQEVKFHIEHIDKHLKSAIEHTQKLHDHLADNYPKEGNELIKMETARPETYRQNVIKKASDIGKGK